MGAAAQALPAGHNMPHSSSMQQPAASWPAEHGMPGKGCRRRVSLAHSQDLTQPLLSGGIWMIRACQHVCLPCTIAVAEATQGSLQAM